MNIWIDSDLSQRFAKISLYDPALVLPGNVAFQVREKRFSHTLRFPTKEAFDQSVVESLRWCHIAVKTYRQNKCQSTVNAIGSPGSLAGTFANCFALGASARTL
jgi:hypothetical protein